MNEVLQAISTVGFPIFSALAVGFFCYKQIQTQREDIKDVQKQYMELYETVNNAINNNTLALQRLTDKLDGRDKE